MEGCLGTRAATSSGGSAGRLWNSGLPEQHPETFFFFFKGLLKNSALVFKVEEWEKAQEETKIYDNKG